MQSLWKTVWRLFKKLKIELPYDPGIPLLAFYPKKTKTLVWKDICIAVLCTIAKILKQPMCSSINEWIKKMWYTHTHINTQNGTLLSHKKELNLAVCDNMERPRGNMLSEISQTEKDKYHMISLTYEILKKNTNGQM